MSKDNETRVNTPRIENAAQAFGIGVSCPRLSWTVTTAAQNWRQSAYEIEISAEDQAPRQSGRVNSDQSVLVPWPFEAVNITPAPGSARACVGSGWKITDWSEPSPCRDRAAAGE